MVQRLPVFWVQDLVRYQLNPLRCKSAYPACVVRGCIETRVEVGNYQYTILLQRAHELVFKIPIFGIVVESDLDFFLTGRSNITQVRTRYTEMHSLVFLLLRFIIFLLSGLRACPRGQSAQGF